MPTQKNNLIHENAPLH